MHEAATIIMTIVVLADGFALPFHFMPAELQHALPQMFHWS